MKTIKSKTEYPKTKAEILFLMNKGEANVTNKIRELALAAQAYEKNICTTPLPATLEGLIEMKMHGKKMNKYN